MKKRICLFVCGILCMAQIFCGCVRYTNPEEKLLRIHVRADSDSAAAQAVKGDVVAAIQYYLSDTLSSARTFDQAYDAVKARLCDIAALSSGVLRRKGFGYGASARLAREHFPEKNYNGKTVPAGEYDALIVNLGCGGGDNWWCVLYPQLCYTPAMANDGAVYKSLIAELWNKR